LPEQAKRSHLFQTPVIDLDDVKANKKESGFIREAYSAGRCGVVLKMF